MIEIEIRRKDKWNESNKTNKQTNRQMMIFMMISIMKAAQNKSSQANSNQLIAKSTKSKLNRVNTVTVTVTVYLYLYLFLFLYLFLLCNEWEDMRAYEYQNYRWMNEWMNSWMRGEREGEVKQDFDFMPKLSGQIPFICCLLFAAPPQVCLFMSCPCPCPCSATI